MRAFTFVRNFVGDAFTFIKDKVNAFFDAIGLGGDKLTKAQSNIESWIESGKKLGELVGVTLVASFGLFALKVGVALAPVVATVGALSLAILSVKEGIEAFKGGGGLKKTIDNVKAISKEAGLKASDSFVQRQAKLVALGRKAGITNFTGSKSELDALGAFVNAKNNPSNIGNQIATNAQKQGNTTNNNTNNTTIEKPISLEINLDGEKITEAVNKNQTMQKARAN